MESNKVRVEQSKNVIYFYFGKKNAIILHGVELMRSIKTLLINLSRKCKTFGVFLRKSRLLIKRIEYFFYRISFKVDDKLIVFDCFNGRNYADSPRALYLEMISDKKYKDFKYVWFFKDIDANKKYFRNHKKTFLVKDRSKEAYRYFASAKYVIVNAVLHEEIKKKKGQVFVQCWHGTPLKKLRCDIEYESNLLKSKKEIKRTNDIDVKRFDYFISPSKFCTEKFISAFNLKELKKEDILIETGYPRNDILFKYSKKDVDSVKKELKIPNNKKVILYAPTFRDNQYKSGTGFSYELGLNLDELKEELNDEYIILFRTHYYVTNSIDLNKYKEFVYDVSTYNDISDLYIISDLLITDYSSVFFDYANLRRPILFYMYDRKEYRDKLRDFYFDLKILPGPIVEKEEDLIKNIKNINMYYDLYNNKYKAFNKKFNYLDSSASSKKVLDIVIKGDK